MVALAQAVADDPGTEMDVLAEGDGPHLLAWRDWVETAEVITETGCFEEHSVLDALDATLSIRVSLDGGASCFVEPTRALVAVDVNTGSDTSLAAGIKANMACARALPRALRLRVTLRAWRQS